MEFVAAKRLQPKNRFQETDPFSDIILVVEDQKLHVIKSLLMIHSPVFEKMFTDDFKEKGLSEISLPGKKSSAIVHLLEQIYPGNAIDLIKDETMVKLLELANEYDMEQVFHNCKQYIGKQLYECRSTMTTERIVFYLWIIEKYDQLRVYRQELVYRASRENTTDIASTKHFLSLPATVTRDVFYLRMRVAEEYTNCSRQLVDLEDKKWRLKMN